MAEISSVVSDLAPRLEGGRIERIDQPGEDRVVLRVRNRGATYWLLLCVHPRFSRLHLLPRRPAEGRPAAGFCNVVREHLSGAPLLALRQVPDDRIVTVEAEERDSLMRAHAVRLVAELVGVSSNLVLVDESDRVLAVLHREESRRRTLVPGRRYEPLEAPEHLPAQAHRNRFESAVEPADALALSRAIAAHYAALEAADEFETARCELLGQLEARLARAERRLRKVETELGHAERADAIRRRGELLKIALPRMRKGQTAVEVTDVFDPDTPTVTIQLDPALTPLQNMQVTFEEYRKADAAAETLRARADRTRREVQRLRQAAAAAAEAGSCDEVATLRREALEAGLLAPPASRTEETDRNAPRRFVSQEGLRILVARNRRQNDELTFTIARGNDYWFHVLGWPGPHVVVRKPPDKAVSPETLLDAAHLAVHFSKIRGTDYAEVIYTQCKNVRRLKGAPKGTVSYAETRTLQVRVSRRRLGRLLGNSDASK